MSTSKPLDVVVGGQFGSEAKGHVTHRLLRARRDAYTKDYTPEWIRRNPFRQLNIRVAGPNAGHTVITDSGVALPLRTIPVGVATPGTILYLAPGSEIDPDVLWREVAMCENAGFTDLWQRLYISTQATMLTKEHIFAEIGMHEEIGSTGKGIGAARAERLMRRAPLVEQYGDLHGRFNVVTPEQHPEFVRQFDHVVVEGTQGYGLGLHAGFYPYCTSSDCRAIDFLAMAGINPWDRQYGLASYTWNLEVFVTLRPYPIRVAGNSGPLLGETTWEALGLPEEKTTVTQKTRRVGAWDPQLAKAAVEANGGHPVVRLALTMLDQVFPKTAGETNEEALLDDDVEDYLAAIERDCGATIGVITTGPNTGWVYSDV